MTITATEWGVWEHLPTGRVLRTFADEDLAMQFAVSVGSKVEPLNVAH